MTVTPAPRHEVQQLNAYRSGRSLDDIQDTHSFDIVCRLAQNEMPYPPLRSVVDKVQRASLSINRYPSMRPTVLAERLAELNKVDLDSVIVGPGSVGLLWQLSQAYLTSASHVVAPSPSFEGYPLIAQMCGASITQVPLHNHAVSIKGMVEAITDETDLVIVAEPNNPTGTRANGPTSPNDSKFIDLVRATRGQALLVIDEAYIEFDEYSDDNVKLVTSNDHVILLRTFSKAYGLAALRVGYAVGSPEVLGYIDRVGAPFSVNQLGQVAAMASLEAADELAQRVDDVRGERNRLVDELNHMGLDTPRSFTNFIWMPVGEASVSVAASLEERGVISRPVASYGIRVTVGTPAENDRFLAAVRKQLPNLKGQLS